jgi:LysM repeat protein
VRLARSAQAWLQDHAGASVGSIVTSARSGLHPFATPERALPVAVAALVAVASLLAVMPSTPAGAVGGVTGSGESVRIAIGGGYDSTSQIAVPPLRAAAALDDMPSFTPIVLPQAVTTDAQAELATADAGNFRDDGTLMTGYAPDTEVVDGSDLISRYKVKAGDTLGVIAHRFGVSMMTLWWANKLDSKDDLHIGQILRIPPVSGLVVTVKDTDTLDSLAAKYEVKPARIVDLNGLEDTTLVVGQVLVVPGAKGAPIPTPKPTPKPQVKWLLGRLAARGPLHRRAAPLARGRWWQLHQPVRPRRAHGARYRRGLWHAGRRGDGWPGRVRRLEEQRRWLAGLDQPRRWDVHHLQPHVGVVDRQRAIRRARPARRSHRCQRLGDRPAPALRGLAGWHAVVRRLPGQPAALLLATSAARSADRSRTAAMRQCP